MMACGVVVGWTYLRFYQSRGKGMRGDMSENFSAATLFPKPLRFVNKITTKPTAAIVIFRITAN